jgi:hypothetical protein
MIANPLGYLIRNVLPTSTKNTLEAPTIMAIVLAVVLMAGLIAMPSLLRPRSKDQ